MPRGQLRLVLFASDSTFQKSLRFRLCFWGGWFFFLAGSREGAPHSVIALVACVFKQRTGCNRHWNFRGPRLDERRRIVDCKLVEQGVGIGAPEAFGEPHVLAGSSERRLIV